MLERPIKLCLASSCDTWGPRIKFSDNSKMAYFGYGVICDVISRKNQSGWQKNIFCSLTIFFLLLANTCTTNIFSRQLFTYFEEHNKFNYVSWCKSLIVIIVKDANSWWHKLKLWFGRLYIYLAGFLFRYCTWPQGRLCNVLEIWLQCVFIEFTLWCLFFFGVYWYDVYLYHNSALKWWYSVKNIIEQYKHT